MHASARITQRIYSCSSQRRVRQASLRSERVSERARDEKRENKRKRKKSTEARSHRGFITSVANRNLRALSLYRKGYGARNASAVFALRSLLCLLSLALPFCLYRALRHPLWPLLCSPGVCPLRSPLPPLGFLPIILQNGKVLAAELPRVHIPTYVRMCLSVSLSFSWSVCESKV